jgi:hypothetical protein
MKYFVTGNISENIHETPEGYLVCIGVPIARTGEMEYGPNETPLDGDDDGHVVVTRDEAEVFRPETIASFEGKAITISHPNDFVGPHNWKDLAKGILQNVRRGKGDQKDDLIADLLITDKMAIGLVKNGLREVSCGYEADYLQIEDGKGKQKNIVGNHLALVDQGRAGHGYAINDHKGDKRMKYKDRIKALFSKAQDEAMKIAEDEDKKDQMKDEDKDDDKKSEDAGAYDELVKMVDALGAKIDAMKPAKDDASGTVVKKEGKADDDDKEDKKDDKKADDAEASIEDRVKALEAAISKLLDNKSGDEGMDKTDDDDMEETDDEDMEDDDFESSSLVGDSAEVISRAEILAPGIKKSKDIKVKALKAAYGTEDGKKVIEALTGGKTPTFDSKEKVNSLFISASEVMKVTRQKELSKTKRTQDYVPSIDKDPMVTAEKMNELNAKFYAKA